MSCVKSFASVRKKTGKQFVMGITMIESTVKFAKVAWT